MKHTSDNCDDDDDDDYDDDNDHIDDDDNDDDDDDCNDDDDDDDGDDDDNHWEIKKKSQSTCSEGQSWDSKPAVGSHCAPHLTSLVGFPTLPASGYWKNGNFGPSLSCQLLIQGVDPSKKERVRAAGMRGCHARAAWFHSSGPGDLVSGMTQSDNQ